MMTVCIFELCGYGKQIAPILMMTITAVTTISILLCKAKKKKKMAPTEQGAVHKETTVRVSFRDKQGSAFSEPILQKNYDPTLNSNFMNSGPKGSPMDLTQGESGLFQKDDATPLFSDRTEDDADARVKDKSIKDKRTESIDQTQVSSLPLDPTTNDSQENGKETHSTKTMLEIPPWQLLDLKKVTQVMKTVLRQLPPFSDLPYKGDTNCSGLRRVCMPGSDRPYREQSRMKQVERTESQVSTAQKPSAQSVSGDEWAKTFSDETFESSE